MTDWEEFGVGLLVASMLSGLFALPWIRARRRRGPPPSWRPRLSEQELAHISRIRAQALKAATPANGRAAEDAALDFVARSTLEAHELPADIVQMAERAQARQGGRG